MYTIAAGLVLLGGIFGATIRLMPFIAVLITTAAVAAISTSLQGEDSILLRIVIAVVALQVGYAAGIVIRASWRARKSTQPRVAGRNPAQNVRVPKQH